MRESSTPDTATIASSAGRLLKPGQSELAVSTLGLIVDTLLALRRDNYDVILVTSGAVGVGCRELGVPKRPCPSPKDSDKERARVLADIQAFAAVGQSVLMRTYDSLAAMANQKVAQVLLSSGDLGRIYQYQNAKNTLSALLKMNVIPIINENDTVATEEIKYGDNDWLSALVSTTVGAEWLFLLSDIDQLYTANPKVDSSAKPIHVVPNIESLDVNLSSNTTGSQWGTGGMVTKITAARLATAAGVKVCLLNGRHPSRVLDFVRGNRDRLGTIFEPFSSPLKKEHKKWLSNCLPPRGEVMISEKASELLRCEFPLRIAGVRGVNGNFDGNSAVTIRTEKGLEIARGISNYSSEELNRFKGMTHQMLQTLGVAMSETVIHEHNVALLVDNGDNSISPEMVTDKSVQQAL